MVAGVRSEAGYPSASSGCVVVQEWNQSSMFSALHSLAPKKAETLARLEIGLLLCLIHVVCGDGWQTGLMCGTCPLWCPKPRQPRVSLAVSWVSVTILSIINYLK